MWIQLPAGIFRRIMAVISIPLCLAVTFWAVLGRVPFGIHGTLTWILALTMGPALLILLLLASVKITVNAARHRPVAASLRASLLLLAVAAAGFGFGFTMPDVGEHGGSLLSQVAGPVALQMSWGVCNTLGIVLLGLSVTLLVIAVRDTRQADRLIEEHVARTVGA